MSPRDYRAWYGLGQTYELMKMPYFALYYFRRCVQCLGHRRGVLKPDDNNVHIFIKWFCNSWTHSCSGSFCGRCPAYTG